MQISVKVVPTVFTNLSIKSRSPCYFSYQIPIMATAGTGEVLFQRGVDDEDTDLWDDSALIKAYDHAINTIKRAVKEPSQLVNGEKKPKHHKKSKKNRKNREKNCATPNWQVGNNCMAVYSEDGYSYEAVIASIDPVNRSCLVKYRGYGNEEKQKLADLLPICSEESSANRQSETETDLPSDNDGTDAHQSHVSSGASSNSASVSSQRSSNHKHGNSPRTPFGANHSHRPMPSFKAFGPPPGTPPPFVYNGMPPVFGGMPYSMLPPKPMMPVIPPPILPDAASITDDKDALYGMLISWYMSGYHTGYYQCLKQMEKVTKPERQTGGYVPSHATSARGRSKPMKTNP